MTCAPAGRVFETLGVEGGEIESNNKMQESKRKWIQPSKSGRNEEVNFTNIFAIMYDTQDYLAFNLYFTDICHTAAL